MNAIPSSYAEWRHCITVLCGIALTPGFIRERLTALQDAGDPVTKTFTACYGQAHLDSVIGWLRQAQADLR